MKKISLLKLIVTLAMCNGFAQSPYLPANYTSNIPVNYVKVYEPTAPYTNVMDVLSTSRTVDEVKRTTQYFDGLGRPIQTVSWQTTPLKKDMVAPQVYDEYGREAFQFMPYVANTNDGLLKYDPFTAQQSFNTSMYGAQGETFFYNKTEFEPSPLNRPIKAMAAGNSWVGNNKGVEQQYLINTIDDAVRIWNIDDLPNALPTTTTVYPTGELYKNVSKDEHGKQVVEYKDKEGKVILKQVQIDNTTGNDHTGFYNTYYIYDDFNQLRFVIQPKAITLLKANNWVFANIPSSNNGADIRDELCFYYAYDAQGRMIIKKVPGAGEVHMVYDERDRLVMTQDANMRLPSFGGAGGGQAWMVTLYDELNRPTKTGLWTNSSTRAYHQTQAETQTTTIAYPFATEPTTSWDLLTQTGYDDYSTIPSASGLNANLVTTQINSANFITTYNTAPNYAQPIQITTATKGMPTWTKVKILDGASTPNYLYTLTLYDDYGKPIQTKSKNTSGGQDVATMQYDFAGKVLRTHTSHQKIGEAANTFNTLTKPSYDHVGRVLDIKKTISATGISGVEKTIAVNTYNELGQLKAKTLAPNFNGGIGLENLNYDYNIRGWLTAINKGFIGTTSYNNTTGRYFGFELGYDKATNAIAGANYTKQQYNGNISGTTWKSIGDAQIRKFDYDYDNANRLLKADFNQYSGGSFNQSAGLNFNVKMGDGSLLPDGSIDYAKAYDENGNIKQMQQWGFKVGGSARIDNLLYDYQTNSNKLKKVTDFLTPIVDNGKLGDFKDGAYTIDDYSYDVNGNLKKDLNKDIGNATTDGIVYNYLNLPKTITVRKDANGANVKGTINYTYDATGSKLKKNTTETNATVNVNGTNYTTNITTTTDYISGFIYETKTYSNATVQTALGVPTTLQFFGHEEGRVRMVIPPSGGGGAFVYDYMLKDHLGNVRMVLTEEQKQDIYPAATLENDLVTAPAPDNTTGTAISIENQFYNIDATKIISINTISGYPTNIPNNNGSVPINPNKYSNQMVYSKKTFVTNATTNKIGLGITLKVMAGDNINIFGKSFHKKPAAGYSTGQITNNTAIDILNTLVNTGTITPKGITGTQLQPNFPSIVNNFFTNTPPPTTTNSTPKAGISYLIFDEQFKFVSGGFDMVGTATNTNGTLKNHQMLGINIPNNGYIYVYCSNESNYNVYFDNLQMIHNKSAILEETHYYPFGLTMAGISSKAAGMTENKKKYQQYEFNSDFDINLYESFYRSHDPQLGRFWQIDPRPNDSESTYAAMGNNPIKNIDVLGDSILGRSNNSTANTIESKINSQVTENTNDITKNNVKLHANRNTIVAALFGFRKISKDDFKNAINQSKTLLKKNNELTEQNNYLNIGLEAINLMRADVNNNYSFSPPSNNDGTHNVIKGVSKNVIIEGSDNGLYLHEAVHVRQHLTTGNGMLRFVLRDNVGKLINVSATGTRIGDEVQAYRIQFSFNREAANLFPRKLSDINDASVRGIGENGVFPYRDL